MPWRQRCDLKKSRSEFLQIKAKSRRDIEFSSEPASGPDYKRGGFSGTKPIGKGVPNSAGYCHRSRMGSKDFLRNEAKSWRHIQFSGESASGPDDERGGFLRNEANREFRWHINGTSMDVGCAADKVYFFKYETNEVFS